MVERERELLLRLIELLVQERQHPDVISVRNLV